MTMRETIARRLIAGAAVAALATGALATTTLTAFPASAAPAEGGTTITPNPWYAGDSFDGWGTSLVWFANATGGYPEELREELYQKVFGKDGLNLNIARYNIGGGNASDVGAYLRPGGAVEGWWKADPTGSDGTYGGVSSSYDERDDLLGAWDANDPAHYDDDADETQRWWVERLVADDQISRWETFANSAPYFMTESGYVSGGFDAWAPQLKPSAEEAFVTYLTEVTERLEDRYGISVDTIDPFNEPNTNYWGTTLVDGEPTARQEGMHVSPDQQIDVVRALAAELAQSGTTTDAVIAAMDETNPSRFAGNWSAYPQDVRDAVEQMNVHTYGTDGRLTVRDLAKQDASPLWMSEIEGNWGGAWNPNSIENGLGVSGRIMDDLRELEPQAWVLWQPVEDLYNMEPQAENANWGSIFIDLDCRPYQEGEETIWKSERRVADAGGDSTLAPECGIQVNSKFNTIRNFTHFITEGDHLIGVDDANSTAAVKGDGSGATIVHRNTGTSAKTITLDLSGFGAIDADATVTPYVTTEAPEGADPTSTGIVPGTAVSVDAASRTATLTVPAKSVTTFDIAGVSGVSADATQIEDGHDYQIVGVQSGKALTATTRSPATTITTSATTTEAGAAQDWTAHAVSETRDGTRAFVLESGDGRVLAATSAGTELRSTDVAAAAADPATTWVANSTDGRTFSFMNASTATSLDVAQASSQENTTVGVWGSNGGANQRWTVRDLTPNDDQTLSARTTAGVAPVLPSTVVPRYDWGTGAPASVEWTLPADSAWQQAGRVEVPGTATDVFGTSFPVTAQVDVGGLTVTDPVSLTVAAGSSAAVVTPVLPATVPARVGASENTFDVAVRWDASGLTDDALGATGTIEIPGTATVDGDALPATLFVIVTDAEPRNFAPEPDVTASASSTEGGYVADNTRNGVLDDKGWSNWVSSNKPAQSTLEYRFDERDVNGVTLRFFADGDATSWAQSLQVLTQSADGTWSPLAGYETAVTVESPADGSAPVVEIGFAPLAATGVRVVMNAYPETHLIVSEVQLFEPSATPADVSSLAALRVDGEGVDGFAPDDTAYAVTTDGSRYPRIDAIPVDREATVAIDPATDGNGGVATVTVTSADGSTTTVYTVTIDRRAVVLSVSITGDVRAGATVTAVADVDPAGSAVTYEWLLDGEPIDADVEPSSDRVAAAALAADTSSLVIPADAEGALLSVRAVATADGFEQSATVESEAVRIAAALPVQPENPGEEGPSSPGSDPGNGAGNGSGAGNDPSLAVTGANAAPWLAIASVILALGMLALWLGRVMRRS
jgi:hypothetical protein